MMYEDILNLKYYKGEDLYSDGEIEDELLRIVQENEDFSEILEKDNRWPILYHLSPIRENLLEWYDYKEGASVLEIGAGCGAVTGVFCKKVQKVVGIELSKKRSLINANRNGKNGNLEIIVGNFEDIVIEDKYDYVTLIGVLEYSPMYINSKNPFVDMLKKTQGMLKDDGELIVAIENKMGLKYMAGATEDHTGRAFDGVNGYVGINHVNTLTKNQLECILHQAGYKTLKFYYPFPDYKLPNVIYSEHMLPTAGDLRNITTVYDRERFETFNEEAVFDQLCEDKKVDYFANSFLIFASK